MKKFTSIILSVVLIFNIFCALGITVSAEITDEGTITEAHTNSIEEPMGEPDESGMLGENVWYKFYNNGTLVIGGEGDTYNFEWNEEYGAVSPLYNKTDIKKVIIQDYVQVLGENLFLGCSDITSVTIGKGITKICESFASCSKIFEVYTDSLWHWCNIDFETYISSSDYGIIRSNPLSYGSNLYISGELVKDVVIPNGVKSLKGTFSGAQNIKSVVIPDSVEEVYAAFSNCKRLENVSLPKNLECIGDYCFYNCERLTDISFPNQLKIIGEHSFYNSGLLSINLPENVETIGDCSFSGTKISEVIIPDCVKFLGSYAFRSCSNLSSVTIGTGLKSIGFDAFEYCENINSIHIKDLKSWCGIDFENYASIPSCENYVTTKFYINGKATTNLRIPDDVKTVNKYAFYNLRFKNVYIPKSVENIGSYAFSASQNIYIDNPDCFIYWDSYTLIGSLYGKAGSTTEEYAKEFGKQFTEIEDYDCENNKHLMITVDEKEATCTEDGYIDSQCLICGNAPEHKEIKATGHNYNVSEELPSCNYKGYKYYYCDKCENGYTETIEKIPHNYSNGYCTMCGKRDPSLPTQTTKPTSADGWVVVKAPACDESGVEVNYSKQKSRTLPALGHKTKLVGKKSATYFTKGYTGDKKCTVCGKVVSKGKAIAKLKLATPKVKITTGKKKLTVKYTKVKDATGFQVKYTYKGKTKTYTFKKSITKTIKKLKKGSYKVSVRALIKSKGKTAYSKWTKAKKYKVK